MSDPAAHWSPDNRQVLAYVVSTLNPGGTEKLVVEMSLAFGTEYRLHVICLDEPGVWAADLRQQGIPVTCLWRQPGLDLRMAWRLARALRACGAQLVHAHQCTPWFYAALSRLLYRRPRLMLEEHGRFFPERDSPSRRLINRLLIRRLTHCFVAVSEDIRGRLRRYEGLNSASIEVIYNGVSAVPRLDATERARLRQELGFGPDSFVVGTVGRFDPIKNLPMLVRSVAQVRGSDARICALLVGEGPQFEEICGLIEELGLSGSFVLTGFRGDARRLVQCLDLFVLASFSEGTSIALLEAMAVGTPVAVTAVGGNTEVVLAGKTGWVVPSGDVAALAAAIKEAAAGESLRQARARDGRRRFEELFSFATMIASYRRLYIALAARA